MPGGERGRRVSAVVAEQLPSGLYQLVIDGTDRVVAHVAEGRQRNFVRLLVGDRVEVELTSRDLTRGRVLRKL